MTGQYAFALIGLTAMIAVLAAVLTFAALRFFAAARDTSRRRPGGSDSVLLSAALEEAVGKLRAQEQAMSARAEASERLSEEIVASLTAGLLVVSDSGGIEILNPAGRRLLGVEDGALPVHFHDLLGAAGPLAAAIDECLHTGRAILRRAITMPDGRTHLGVTVSPMSGKGETHGAICLFSDLTAVMDLEEQLRLREALARLGELTAGIAHEFRNGLATIHGYGRLIEPQALPPQYRPYVEGIRQETEALGRVVTNFLNFAKPERPMLVPVDLGAVIARAVEDIGPEVGVDGGSIEIRGTFGLIDGDDTLLRQALLNLLRNALQACRGAGIVPKVTVEGQIDEAPGACRFSVQDNGPGIPADAQGRVFQPFFTTRSEGTGLGLALVQKIVVLHDGRVSVSSTARGARFDVVLPLRRGATSAPR